MDAAIDIKGIPFHVRDRGKPLMKNLARAVVAAGFWILWVTGCSESEPLPDVQILASDLHFTIADQHIVTPAVAISMPDHTFDLSERKPKQSLRDRLTLSASDPGKPARTDHLDLVIRQYSGDYLGSRNICPLLRRKWSQSLCLGTHDGLLRRLPERFELLDRNKLDLLEYHWTVGKERQYDQVNEMDLRAGAIEIGCDKQSEFCTAVIETLPGLLAVWTVCSNENTEVTARTMADTQGAAIVQFVRRALGPVEDPTLVDAS